LQKRISILLLFITASIAFNALAQLTYIDSLQQALKEPSSDSGKFETLSKLAIAYSDSSYAQSLEYWKQALNVAERVGLRTQVADAYHQIGYSYMKMGEFQLSLQNLENAASIYQHLNNLKSLAGVYNDMGLIYRNWGKYDKALEFYLMALQISRDIGNAEGIGIASNSIGQIHFYQNNLAKAIEFFVEYLNINKTLENYRAVAGASNNIASAYLELGKYNESLEYFLKALQIYDSLKVSIGVAIIQDNIGSLYYKQNQYDNALLYHQKALEIFELLGATGRMCYTLKNIGQVYLAQGKIQRAIDKFKQALNAAKKIDLKDVERDGNELLATCYEKTGNYQLALQHLREHIAIKDSILNSETVQKIEELQAQYERDKQELLINQMQGKLKNRNLFIGLLVVFIIFSGTGIELLVATNRKKNQAIKQLEEVRSYMLQNVSANLNSLELVKSGLDDNGLFSDYWNFLPFSFTPENNKYFFHFSINQYTFCYLILTSKPRLFNDLINLNIYKLVKEYLNQNKEVADELSHKIFEFFNTDPLLKLMDRNDFQVFPFVVQGNRLLNLYPQNIGFRQFGSFIISNTIQWVNLRPGDVVYLFGNFSNPKALNEIRKVVKSIDLIEFDEQKEVAVNFLHSMELNTDVFILALRV